MILGHEDIIKNIDNGNIIISPFKEELVSINSVDIRLGRECWRMRRDFHIRDVYAENLSTTWEEVKPVKASEMRLLLEWEGEGIPNDAECLAFNSDYFYLATTYEKIGTSSNSNLVPEMKSKSTFGRNGLTTALCAGLGDKGYHSIWALEVRIAGSCIIPIAVGTPIGQVVFHEITKTDKSYNGKDRYQDGDSVRILPKPMSLPKL